MLLMLCVSIVEMVTCMKIRRYSDLAQLTTFKDRYEYLRLNGQVGQDTFGFDRYLNQKFYKSKEWKQVRDYVIVRDNCCDLAMDGYELYGRIYIHHMNPLTPDDIKHSSDFLLNPEFLITVSLKTHNAIHFGDEDQLPQVPIERTKYDTCPWKH